MNAEELAGIPIWIDREVSRRQIPRLFSDLATAVQQNANGSIQAFETQRSQLITELAQVDATSLTNAQSEFLEEKINLLKHLSREGVAEVEGILFRNSLDIHTAANELNKILAEVQSAIDRSNQLKSALDGLIDPFEVPVDEITLRVVFDHDASIRDIVDFKRWGAEWHDIGRGIAMAAGASPEEIRVVGAQTGSIILTLATSVAIAKIISAVLLKTLEVAEKVQGLRKAELEIKGLKLSNTQLADAIKLQADSERKIGLKAIASSISKENPAIDGERFTALEKSVGKLLKFIEKGGEVDVVLPLSMESKEASNGEAQRLRDDVTRIRELEQEMKRIPFLSHQDNVAED